ncbi:hypothetical protein VH569_22750 [Azospirillum sp. 11R-A]|uniref:hypothetical protein n=1 Tax=Azospirillum sp. 11R-A TaxID=3111634 RepID=UPI003C1545A2
MRKNAMMIIMLALAAPAFLSGCGLARSKEISAATAPAQLAQFRDKDLCNPHVDETAVVLKERAARGLGDCTVEHVQCVRTGFAPGTDGYLRCRSSIEQRKAAQAVQSSAEAERWAQIGAMGQQMMQPPAAVPVAPSPAIRQPLVCNHYRNQTICQ